MAKKSKSKKSTMIYLAAILFSALVIGMAFLPVFTYKTAVGPTHINGFQMMQGAFSEKIEGSIASLVRTLISNAENVKTAAIFILVAIIFAGLSALSALAGLFAGKSWRMVQFLLMAVCFVACLVAIILLFVAGGDLSSEFFNTSATVNAGAYLMVLFSLLGAGSCICLLYTSPSPRD